MHRTVPECYDIRVVHILIRTSELNSFEWDRVQKSDGYDKRFALFCVISFCVCVNNTTINKSLRDDSGALYCAMWKFPYYRVTCGVIRFVMKTRKRMVQCANRKFSG